MLLQSPLLYEIKKKTQMFPNVTELSKQKHRARTLPKQNSLQSKSSIRSVNNQTRL